jgi:preprotein translocase subunit YajC
MEETNAPVAPVGTETTATVEQPPKGKDASAQPQEPGSMIWIVLVIWVVVIYLFFMRPQKKKEQQRKEMLGQLKKGDEIVTIGGIHGTIVSINDQTAKVKVDDKAGTTMVFSRAAISGAPAKEAEEVK